MSDTTLTVGRSVPRRGGGEKVPKGRIRSNTLDPAFEWGRVTVVTADDIPGENVVQLIRDDQPVLARKDGEIRHREEPILLVAAASHIRIEYDTAPPVFDLDKATELLSSVEISKGKVLEDLEDLEGVEV